MTSTSTPAVETFPPSKRGRPVGWLPGIEALRGIAAGTVVLHHAWSLSYRPQFPGYWLIEGFGSFGVNLFFLLSGYLLCDYFWRAPERRSLRQYGLRRFFRIGPAYYVNIIILFVFFAQHDQLFSWFGVRQVLANLTFTQYLFPATASSLNVNGALWTLTAEFFLYLTLPVMALLFARAPLLVFTALVSLGVAWRSYIVLGGDTIRGLYFGSGGPDEAIQSLYLSRQFIGLVPIFALGIGLKWLVTTGRLERVRRWLPQRMSVPALVLALAPAMATLYWVEAASTTANGVWFVSFDYVMALLLCPALLLAAQPSWRPASPLAHASTWLGDRSYSLYLWHFPIILSVYGRGSTLAEPQITHVWIQLALVGVLSVLFAHVSYEMVERPGQDWGRRLAARVRREGRSGG